MLVDVSLLILRLTTGLLLAGHGSQKLFGWFGGPGIRRWGERLEALGYRPSRFWAILNGLGEFGGGILLAFGLLTPAAAAVLTAVMLVAVLSVHWANGLWSTNRGFEYNLTLITVWLAIALAGPGAYSLDRWLGLRLPDLPTFLGTLVASLLIAAAGGLLTGHRSTTRQRTT
jgi:putative oxidoreductase